jgi:hypothetical protein
MIRAMVWKEYREHRAIWLALALVGGAGLYGLSQLMAPGGVLASNGAAESLQAVAALLAWTYGLVCGSMLLANERECATLDFLDMLPVRRLELWLVKGIIGLVLFLAQVAVLAAFVLGLGITETPAQTTLTLLAMLFFGLLGMAWGVLFSARGESVLNVIGLAILGQLVGSFLTSVLCLPFIIGARILFPSNPLPLLAVVAFVALIVLVGPVFVSARIFTQPDRLRGLARERVLWTARARRSAGPSLWAGYRRMIWLSYSQMRRLLLGLSIFSLALGLMLPAAGPAMWGILTLFIGVICGVSVCADEQLHGSFRFLGDQRFPLGRVWLVKMGMRFALAVFASFLLVLPSLAVAIFHRVNDPSMIQHRPFFGDLLHSSLVGPVIPVSVHLMMWLLYGFTVGQLGGLLFRKSLVAGVVSLGGTALLVSLWIPSLLGIGLHFWQVAVPPLILLLVALRLVPAWAADRLLARGTFMRLGAAFAAIALWMTFGLWYRVAEIPDTPQPFDVRAFAASMPSPEKNDAGRNIRTAWTSVDTLVRLLGSRSQQPLFPVRQQFPGGQPFPRDNDLQFQAQVLEVSEHGWPGGKPELGEWLDREFGPDYRDRWYTPLAEAAEMPLGMVEDARRLNISDRKYQWSHALPLSHILAARGLQQQARGDARAFVDNLRIGLALVRNLQHFAPPEVAHWGTGAEAIWPTALDRWLERLQGHPELLRQVLAILTRHEAETPDPKESVNAGYLVALNSLEQVPEVLLLMETGPRSQEDAKMLQAEIDAAALMWRIPWEQERHQRILRLSLHGNGRQRRDLVERGGTALGMILPNMSLNSQRRSKRQLADLHAAQLKVALRLYQAETGKPAAALDVLVPRYLPVIPVDPFDGQPFRYRLSRGERLVWPNDPRVAAAGPAQQEAPAAPEPFPPGGAGVPGEMAGAGPGAPMQPPAMMAGPHLILPPAPGRDVPASQGILWSVGDDRHDDGGLQQVQQHSRTNPGEDIIYLVPPPPK